MPAAPTGAKTYVELLQAAVDAAAAHSSPEPESEAQPAVGYNPPPAPSQP